MEPRPTRDELIAFVRKIAGMETCQDSPDKCEQDSGPYCGWHFTGQWMEEEIAEARAILAGDTVPAGTMTNITARLVTPKE